MMKIVKILLIVIAMLAIVVLFPLNPYLSVALALLAIGAMYLIRRK